MNLFNERRAAQAAAYLLHRSATGTLPLIKLIKLLYLAERRSLEAYGEPITGDYLVSMKHGPVLSRTLNLMNGAEKSAEGGWETWVSDRAEHQVALRDPTMIRSAEQDLMELSESDVEVLEEVWQKFGHWDRWKLVDYTHEHLPEWEKTNSSVQITYDKLFAALGYKPEQVSALMQRLKEQSYHQGH